MSVARPAEAERLDAGPFVGPRPFEVADRHLFFGRDREAHEVSSLVLANRIFVLYAMSGAGKTSLVNAGVLPLVEDELEVLPTARLVVRDPDSDDAANVYAQAVLSCWTDSGELPDLRGTTLAQYLAGRERVVEGLGGPRPRLLVFDQFEELFTAHPERWPDRAGFLEQLAEATDADPGLRVLVVLREDFLSRLLAFADTFADGLKDRYFLEPLRKPAARLAITGPVENQGRSFAPDAADDLVRKLITIRVDLGNSRIVQVEGEFIEPVLLQVVCQKLWAGLSPEIRAITAPDIHDVGTSLGDFYSEAVRRAADLGQVPERQIREWVGQNLLTHPGGTRGTVHVGARATAGLPNQTVELLLGTLLRAEFRAGARWLEITHDSLLGPIERSNAAFFRAQGPLSREADALALAEAGRWQAVVAARRLNDPAPLDVSWTGAEPALMDSWEEVARPATGPEFVPPAPAPALAGGWVSEPGELAGSGSLADLVDRLPSRRLVVIGEPGSGKSMLLARLVLELLGRRATGDPVPVLVSASTWDPVAQDLHGWLGTAVDAAGPGLVSAGLIQPVLDDLDEMAPAVRRVAISRINDALRPGDFLIAACRTREYRQVAGAPDASQAVVRSAAVIQLDPLDRGEVDRYLRACAGNAKATRAWETVLAALGTGNPVDEALASPLMVGLARARYGSTRPGTVRSPGPSELCDPDLDKPDSVAGLLLESFVATACSATPGSGPAWKTERSLSFLARHVERMSGDHGFAWWQMARATPRYALGLLTGVTIGLLAAAGCAAAVVGGRLGGIEDAVGVTLGLVLAYGLAADRRPLRGAAAADLAPVSPEAALRLARRTALVAAAGYGIPAGAGAGLAAGLEFGVVPGLVAALLAASMTGLASAALYSAWLRWQLTRGWLALNGSLPWRSLDFLADAHALGALRREGPYYQFRYAGLRRSLVDARAAQVSRPGYARARRPRERLQTPVSAAVALGLCALLIGSFAISEQLHASHHRAGRAGRSSFGGIAPPSAGPPPASEATAPTPVASLPTGDRRSAQVAAFSPGGRLLAVGDAGGAVNLWNLAGHRLVASFAVRRSSVISSVAFSPNGRSLAAGDSDGEIYLWNLASRRLRSDFSCVAKASAQLGTTITDITFSPAGNLLAVAMGQQDAFACSAHQQALSPFFVLPDVGKGAASITATAFNERARTIAVGSTSGRAYVFELSGSNAPHLVSAPNPLGVVTSIAFSPDGRVLALAASNGVIRLFSPMSLRSIGAPIADPGRSRGINSVAFSPNGRLLAAADGNGSTYLSNVSTGRLVNILPDPASAGVRAVAFSADNSQLVTADLNGVSYLWALSGPSPPVAGGAFRPSEAAEATALNNLLMSSAQTRSQWDAETLIVDVGTCSNVSSASAQIGDIAASRALELAQARNLRVDKIRRGPTLKETLIDALATSLTIDRDYEAWAKQQISTGCTLGVSSLYYRRASNLDARATDLKSTFLNLWNPIASQFGLQQFNAGQI